MSDNQLLGLQYYQFKNGDIYELTFPKEIFEDPLRGASLYRFASRMNRATQHSHYNIWISNTLDACRDTTTKNILAMRQAFDILGGPDSDPVITTDDQKHILNEKETDRNLIRYEILKYTTGRFEELFDKHFLVLEFVAAIKADPGEIVRQLVYMHKSDMLLFHTAYERALGRSDDYLAMLNWRLEFNQSMKAEALELVRSYEAGMEPDSNDLKAQVSEQMSPSSKSVFIVHGRNIHSAEAVSSFIDKCGLQPVMLREKPDQGQTIIEKLEKHGNPGYAIVILAPEDEGRLRKKGENFKGRARQNAVLELGYFMGKIGRDRILCLVENTDDFEKPSDIHGLLYKPFDQTGAWKSLVAKELKAAGYDIDLNQAFS